MPAFKTIPVIGTPVAVVDCDSAARYAIQWALRRDRAYAIEAADVHVIARARHEESFGKVMKKFDMVCPDGMPVLWSVNRGLTPDERLTERVCGADLMQTVMRETAEQEKGSHFLLGGSEATLQKLTNQLPEKIPGVDIAETYSPPFGQWPDDEFDRITSKIKASGAVHIWVGLGCPKQEKWIADNKERLPPGCYYGVGAAFAFHAGDIVRAPGIFQKTGMEWFYRLVREPRRLWKRYLTYNSLFIKYQLFGR